MAGPNHTVDIYTRLARLEERLENFLEDAQRERAQRDARDEEMREAMKAVTDQLSATTASFESAKITGKVLIGVALAAGSAIAFLVGVAQWAISTFRHA